MKNSIKFLFFLLCLSFLSACGGGGSHHDDNGYYNPDDKPIPDARIIFNGVIQGKLGIAQNTCNLQGLSQYLDVALAVSDNNGHITINVNGLKYTGVVDGYGTGFYVNTSGDRGDGVLYHYSLLFQNVGVDGVGKLVHSVTYADPSSGAKCNFKYTGNVTFIPTNY